MISCWPGSASPWVAPSSSDARTPADTQNATSARSRCELSAANSSLNFSSGICRGLRRASLGRYNPVRSARNGSIGFRCAPARLPRPRASGNGFTIGPVPACRWYS